MFKLPGRIEFKLVCLLLAVFFVSCQDDELIEPKQPQNTTDGGNTIGGAPNSEVNEWIYGVMGDVYFWNGSLPEKPDVSQEPSVFFKSLHNSADRFSKLYPDYQKLISALNGVNREAGYDYMLVRDSGSEDGVVALVLYIKNHSPAKEEGIQRGDVISAINGTRMTLTNYKELIGQTSTNHAVSFKRFDEQKGDYITIEDLSLDAIELAENPSHLDTVLTVGDRKIGYYVYNFFSPGPDDKEYDEQMAQIFAEFKSAGITDLVLDLRYNSGGAISSATTLGSLIARGVSSSEIFYENKWNSKYQAYWEGKSNGDEILRGRFKEMTANIGNQLASGKLYVIVGSRTASASELLINGLRPYMEVVLIGEKTVGKNVGSIAMSDKNNPENTYGLLPIVMQVHNSQGFSDYANGFEPDVLFEEFKALPLKPLGDMNEPLLARAIQEITGLIASADKGDNVNARMQAMEVLGSSIDSRAVTNRLIFDLPRE